MIKSIKNILCYFNYFNSIYKKSIFSFYMWVGIRNFFIYNKNRVYLWFLKTTGISEKIMSILNTKTGKKYRVVELDKGRYCLNDILGGRKT